MCLTFLNLVLPIICSHKKYFHSKSPNLEMKTLLCTILKMSIITTKYADNTNIILINIEKQDLFRSEKDLYKEPFMEQDLLLQRTVETFY